MASKDVHGHKRSQILDACCQENVDDLKKHATSEYGLIDDSVRKIAWPVLLGSSRGPDQGYSALPKHRDEHQVQLDVDRAFVYYPHGDTEKQIQERRQDLHHLIVLTLRSHPFLCYFQGFHDIVQVLLLVLGRRLAAPAVARLSLLRIRDFMLPTLAATKDHLALLPAILRLADDELAHHLSQTPPFFALAGTLTLYAHDIQEYGDVARLFDFLLAHESIITVYLFAVIIISRREELLEIPSDEPDMLHFVLSKLPKPLDLESLIAKTMVLYHKHPPGKLPVALWWRIPSCSVLKTTRDTNRVSQQTLEDGRKYFEAQVILLERAEMLSKIGRMTFRYRKPIGAAGAAVLAVALSYYFRADTKSLSFIFTVWPRLRTWMS